MVGEVTVYSIVDLSDTIKLHINRYISSRFIHTSDYTPIQQLVQEILRVKVSATKPIQHHHQPSPSRSLNRRSVVVVVVVDWIEQVELATVGNELDEKTLGSR